MGRTNNKKRFQFLLGALTFALAADAALDDADGAQVPRIDLPQGGIR